MDMVNGLGYPPTCYAVFVSAFAQHLSTIACDSLWEFSSDTMYYVIRVVWSRSRGLMGKVGSRIESSYEERTQPQQQRMGR